MPVVVLLLVVGVASFLAALVSAQAWAPWAWLALAVAGLALVGRFTVFPVVRWRTTHFVVTDRRVLVREGVFSRHGMDIPLKRISSVQFRQSLFERMVGSGTLVVESDSDESLEFDDVPGVRAGARRALPRERGSEERVTEHRRSRAVSYEAASAPERRHG